MSNANRDATTRLPAVAIEPRCAQGRDSPCTADSQRAPISSRLQWPQAMLPSPLPRLFGASNGMRIRCGRKMGEGCGAGHHPARPSIRPSIRLSIGAFADDKIGEQDFAHLVARFAQPFQQVEQTAGGEHALYVGIGPRSLECLLQSLVVCCHPGAVGQCAADAGWVGGEGKAPSPVGASPRRALATPPSLASRRQKLKIAWRTTIAGDDRHGGA